MSPSRHGIVLVLDSDDAGQRATESSGKHLLQLFEGWGVPRYPREPTSHAVAHVQRAIDDLAEEIQALDALGVDSLEQSEMRVMVWDYMTDLMRDERVTSFSTAATPEEYENAEAIRATPLNPDTLPKRIDYAAIKLNVDIVSYIERFGPLRQSGRTHRGKCSLPGHTDERTASMYVYPDTNSFYCFGCNRGGDVIEYAKLQGVSARELT
jgi:hypothetical protein